MLGCNQRALVGDVVKIGIDLCVNGRRVQETLLGLACWSVHAIHVEFWVGDCLIDVHDPRLLPEILAAKILVLGLRSCELCLVLSKSIIALVLLHVEHSGLLLLLLLLLQYLINTLPTYLFLISALIHLL